MTSEQEKSTRLHPRKRFHFWWYVAGVLLIPFLGLGFYLIYKKRKELDAVYYHITDRTITAVDSEYSQTLDLANIRSVDVEQRWIDKRFGIGTLQVQTASRTMELIGLEDPDNLADLILHAARAEQARLEQRSGKKPSAPDSTPGSTERMNYLTGLWQQGLISEEDFEKERKHFES